MGRNAHVLRLALGRNADRAPDWALLRDRFAPIEHENDGEPSVYQAVVSEQSSANAQYFNEKGQPVDRAARDLDRARCTAQNAVVYLALPESGSRNEAMPPREHAVLDESEWISMRQMILAIDDTALLWFACFRDRLSVLRSLNSTMSLSDSFSLEIESHGVLETVTAGYLFGIIDSFALDGPLWESIDQLFCSNQPDFWFSELFIKILRNGTLATIRISQTVLIVAAHLQSLRVGQYSRGKSFIPWTGPLRSWNLSGLVPGFLYVLIPAWALSALRLELRAFLQRFLNQEFCHPFCLGYYTRAEWSTWYPKRLPSILRERPDLESNYVPNSILDRWKKFSFLSAFRESKCATGVATSRFMLSLGRGNDEDLAKKTEIRNYYYIEDLSRLPKSLTYSAIADICQQIVLLPVAGIVTRSLAWLFLAPKSPLRIDDALISQHDLYPILPSLADFTPGLGLHNNLRYAGKVALTFVLQTGVSLMLVALKSGIITSMLRKKIKRMVPQQPIIEDDWENVD